MAKTVIKLFCLMFLGVIFLYAVGPRSTYKKVDGTIEKMTIPLASLDQVIAQKEEKITQLKPNNQARIIWYDSIPTKTIYSVVYLHGFSSSQEEGAPIHEDFARRYGCNLFLSRLEDHGRSDTNSFINLTPHNYVESAKEAIAIGNIIGEKTIVISCSTGSTLAAYLSAENPDLIWANIMYSPNIDLYDPTSAALTWPWGKQIAEMSFGGEHNRITYSPAAAQYWNSIYHLNGVLAVKSLINQTMIPEIFQKIDQPLLLGYYYRNEVDHDKVVSVEAMKDFFMQANTPMDRKIMVAFPDAGRHVIASHVLSNDIKGVKKETFRFAEEILGLEPVPIK